MENILLYILYLLTFKVLHFCKFTIHNVIYISAILHLQTNNKKNREKGRTIQMQLKNSLEELLILENGCS